MRKTCLAVAIAIFGLMPFCHTDAHAGAHTWVVNELFSNADGTVQFIELMEAGGGAFETGVGGHPVTSNANTTTIGGNAASPTSFKTILFGTPAFAALPGAPTPDYTLSPNFFSLSGDTVSYVPYSSLTYGAGVLPTDGVRSLNRNLTTSTNSPKNYAGQTGSVNAAPAPAAVPDGSGTSTPMTVVALDSAGSSLSISWDTATCSGSSSPFIIYGQGTQLPTTPGGAFGLLGSVCAIGTTSPFVWNGVPAASDGTGLIWWLLLRNDAAGAEGSWGKDSAGAERIGPGTAGTSGQCGSTSRNLSNTCGH